MLDMDKKYLELIMNDVQNEIRKHSLHPCSDPGIHAQLEFMQKKKFIYYVSGRGLQG